MAEGHSVNGTAIADYATVQSFSLAAPNLDGEDVSVPGRTGLVEGDWTPKNADYLLGLLVLGREAAGVAPAYSRSRYLEKGRALRKLVFNDGRPFTLTRSLDLPSGTQTVQASARYVSGLELDQLAAHAGRCMVRLSLLDGCFYDTADTTVDLPGTITVGGELRTRRIVLGLGDAGTLTNVTLGISLTVTDGGTFDVEDFSVVAPDSSNGIARVGAVTGSDYWFELAPGPNVITWSGGGTPTLTYRAAHL